jgi:hypothetical protein
MRSCWELADALRRRTRPQEEAGPLPTNVANSMRYRSRLREARLGEQRKVAADAHVARREAPAAIPKGSWTPVGLRFRRAIPLSLEGELFDMPSRDLAARR